ncbi:XRE family transcriptional regulator [Aquimarina sp. 2201CG5-10]|uniref:helix-turn-helix domain-containing protein n=1 Tax=Aquimarina callyspongiae TaxID=3098150 RepID=UPI002AB34DBD|nr:XRE family transcriptional regulator [Aquimarina sp. 2201CG5-10]MDY8134713.1 XRE family transcriptional regulator [Aquimarina sp. 2201CG5-10]
MAIAEEYIRLIFGLKIKQIRTDKDLSLFGLSKLCGLSKSYLNEIEKGKKYPKTDKIIKLAETLDVPYDNLVSLKLDKNLAPIGEILQSGILDEIPLELFGIQQSDLIDIIANAPSKVNAFISTIIEIAQHYNMSREGFYLASLRSYQEAHNNFFKDLEDKAIKCANTYQLNLNGKISSLELEEILKEEYGYTINDSGIPKQEELDNLRSVYVPTTKTLLLSDRVDEAQKTFIYAKELGYQYMEIKERPYTFSWIRYDNFEEVLHNFYASYFAGALIIPRNHLKSHLKELFSMKSFSEKAFHKIMNLYNASPESFYQRLTNILPRDFGMQNVFFLRFTHTPGVEKFNLVKELHITHQQQPHANEVNEHYCRQWMAIKTLQRTANNDLDYTFDIQISDYADTDQQYLVFTSATKDPFKTEYYRSIGIGFLISSALEKKIQFVNDSKISKFKVGVTCESCSLMDCKVRMAPPKRLLVKEKHKKTAALVEDIVKQYS